MTRNSSIYLLHSRNIRAYFCIRRTGDSTRRKLISKPSHFALLGRLNSFLGRCVCVPFFQWVHSLTQTHTLKRLRDRHAFQHLNTINSTINDAEIIKSDSRAQETEILFIICTYVQPAKYAHVD